MKLSHLFTKTRKDVPKEETSTNAQFLIKGGFIDKEMAGVYSFLPLGLRVLKKIENIIREEMEVIDGQEILMPTLTSVEKYKTTNRQNLEVLFKTKLYSGADYVLNQSHEEVITPLVQQFVKSYKDLPKAVYQIQNKFRNEPRAKSGLLRGREFLMKDLYSFHTDEKDLDKYYQKAQRAYEKIFARLGIGDITYLTFASGGSFSKYSHEYQTECQAGEDEIYLCQDCRVAVNKEIIAEQKVCPECGNKKLRVVKTIEVGNIFKLMDRFSKAFDYTFTDGKGQNQPVIMGCYGIGISRNMGTIVEVHHDERGIIWPQSIAPFQVQLIELNTKNLKLKTKVEELYDQLQKAGVEVLYDDREVSAGEKFADCDLIGCPIRIVVSDKTLAKNSVEVKKRKQKEGKLVKIGDITKFKF